MLRAGLPVRHLEPKPCSNSIVGLGVTTETGIKEKTVPMYNTNIPCRSAGRFAGNMVVSMRPMMPLQAVHATEVTSRYPRVHGAPLHIGNPVRIYFGHILSLHLAQIVYIFLSFKLFQAYHN